MRIDCCYCGPRGNEEFAYLGDASVQRPPADPASSARRCRAAARGSTTSICATTPPAHIASCGSTSPAAAPGWWSRAMSARTRSCRWSPPATSRSPHRREAMSDQRPSVIPRRRDRHASSPHLRGPVVVGPRRPRRTLTPPRKGRRIRAALAVRRADRSQPSAGVLLRRPHLPRPSRRHAGVGAAGERGAPGRPIVQVSPPARHPHGRAGGAERAGGAAGGRAARAQHARHHGRALRWPGRRQPEPLAVAALRPAGDQLRPRADPVRRLLLQDLHVAGLVLGEGVRAADPPRGRARARRRRGRSGRLREGVPALRRAGGRRRRRGADGRAGGGQDRRPRRAVRGGLPPRRPADRREPRAGRSQLGRLGRPHRSRAGRAAQRSHPAAHDGRSASTTTAPMPRWSASTITWQRRRSTSRASGSGASTPGVASLPPARSSGRWCSATTTVRASCWPAPCGPISTATRSRQGGARSCSAPTTRRRARSPTWPAPASPSKPSSTRVPMSRGASRPRPRLRVLA